MPNVSISTTNQQRRQPVPLASKVSMKGVSRIPAPVVEDWEWQYKGACRNHATEKFFHPEGERGRSRKERVRVAKMICATCPVLEQCRAHALAMREPYGVWGGMSEEERRVETRRLRELQKAS